VFCLLAVLIVGTVTATNNYSKERQFRALEEESRKDERVFVKRGELVEHLLSDVVELLWPTRRFHAKLYDLICPVGADEDDVAYYYRGRAEVP